MATHSSTNSRRAARKGRHPDRKPRGSDKVIPYEVPLGESLKDHAVTMAMLAAVFGREVTTDFNGMRVSAKPGYRMYDVIREWDHACQIECFGEVIYDE